MLRGRELKKRAPKRAQWSLASLHPILLRDPLPRLHLQLPPEAKHHSILLTNYNNSHVNAFSKPHKGDLTKPKNICNCENWAHILRLRRVRARACTDPPHCDCQWREAGSYGGPPFSSAATAASPAACSSSARVSVSAVMWILMMLRESPRSFSPLSPIWEVRTHLYFSYTVQFAFHSGVAGIVAFALWMRASCFWGCWDAVSTQRYSQWIGDASQWARRFCMMLYTYLYWCFCFKNYFTTLVPFTDSFLLLWESVWWSLDVVHNDWQAPVLMCLFRPGGGNAYLNIPAWQIEQFFTIFCERKRVHLIGRFIVVDYFF